MFQQSFNEVLFCNIVVAWISSQLPEQKEGLFCLDCSPKTIYLVSDFISQTNNVDKVGYAISGAFSISRAIVFTQPARQNVWKQSWVGRLLFLEESPASPSGWPISQAGPPDLSSGFVKSILGKLPGIRRCAPFLLVDWQNLRTKWGDSGFFLRCYLLSSSYWYTSSFFVLIDFQWQTRVSYVSSQLSLVLNITHFYNNSGIIFVLCLFRFLLCYINFLPFSIHFQTFLRATNWACEGNRLLSFRWIGRLLAKYLRN